MADLQEKLKSLPVAAGIYLHKNADGKILYVGKAKNLRNRVRQYFQSSRNQDAKTRRLVKAIADFVEEHIRKTVNETPFHHEGHQAAHWILIDYVNVVVHVMQTETRKFYKLEEMWSDGASEEY